MLFITFFLFCNGYLNNEIEGHFTGSDIKIQEWLDTKDMVRIQFAYQPEKPIIDDFTELQFSVQNMSNGDHITDLTGRVTVTNGQRLFKFQNISIPNGDFSVRYLFPDDGTHQVLLRLEEKNKLNEIASFNVFVPHQGPLNISDPFMGDKVYPTIITIGILSGVLIGTIVFIKKRK
jgi:hypothetical protein